MISGKDIFEIRFTGNDISPSNVKPREIAELIVGFEKALLSDIKERHPEIDTNELLFAFEEIRNESLGLRFSPQVAQSIITSSFSFISASFSSGDFSSLNNQTIHELRTFIKFSKKHGCLGEFKLNGEKISSFTPTTELQFNKNPLIKGEIKVFGRVMDSGGDNPNVHLRISDEQVLIFPTTESLAKELAHRLYEKVSLVGIAKWDAITYEIKEFKVKEIVDFVPGSTMAAINELRKLTSGYWDSFNTNDEINNQLLRD